MGKIMVGDGTVVEETPEQEAERKRDMEEYAARTLPLRERKAEAMAPLNANINSVPALRDEVNKIKAFLADIFPDL